MHRRMRWPDPAQLALSGLVRRWAGEARARSLSSVRRSGLLAGRPAARGSLGRSAGDPGYAPACPPRGRRRTLRRLPCFGSFNLGRLVLAAEDSSKQAFSHDAPPQPCKAEVYAACSSRGNAVLGLARRLCREGLESAMGATAPPRLSSRKRPSADVGFRARSARRTASWRQAAGPRQVRFRCREGLSRKLPLGSGGFNTRTMRERCPCIFLQLQKLWLVAGRPERLSSWGAAGDRAAEPGFEIGDEIARSQDPSRRLRQSRSRCKLTPSGFRRSPLSSVRPSAYIVAMTSSPLHGPLPWPHPCHRRRPRRLGSRLADRPGRRAGGAARDAPAARHPRPPDRRARRAGLLQLVPRRRLGAQRRRPAARGDAPRRLADHGARPTPTRCRPAARWRWTARASPRR